MLTPPVHPALLKLLIRAFSLRMTPQIPLTRGSRLASVPLMEPGMRLRALHLLPGQVLLLSDQVLLRLLVVAVRVLLPGSGLLPPGVGLAVLPVGARRPLLRGGGGHRGSLLERNFQDLRRGLMQCGNPRRWLWRRLWRRRLGDGSRPLPLRFLSYSLWQHQHAAHGPHDCQKT